MKVAKLALVSISLVFLLGCAGTQPGPGQPYSGFLFSSTTIPMGMTIDQEFQAYPDSFVVLGLTEGTASNSNILGIFSVGNGGYIAATDNAINKARADGIINCIADVKTTSFLFLFSSSKTIVRGLAIKRKH